MGSQVICPPPVRSRVRQFGPQVQFITVQGQAIGGADADFRVQLNFPCRVIQIASILTITNSVFLHFVQLNKNYAGGNLILPTGRENWIPMTSFPVSTAAPWYWTRLVLADPITEFYLDMGHDNGAANVITFMCTPDPDAIQTWGGPWT